jgi:hypothetical protein
MWEFWVRVTVLIYDILGVEKANSYLLEKAQSENLEV